MATPRFTCMRSSRTTCPCWWWWPLSSIEPKAQRCEVPPAALSKLLVFTDVALVLRPPFSVSKGFEGDMSRNLVLEDVEIVYEVGF